MPVTDQDRTPTSRAQLMRYDFCRPNLAPGAIGWYLYGPRDWILRYTVPFDAELSAVSWHTTLPITAGELLARVLIGQDFQTVKSAVLPAYNGDTDDYRPVIRGLVTLKAGQTLAVYIDSSPDFAPGTLDLSLSLYVMAYLPEGV